LELPSYAQIKYKIVGDQTSPNSTQTRFLYITPYTKSISIYTIIPIFNNDQIKYKIAFQYTHIPNNHSNTDNHFKDDKNISLVEQWCDGGGQTQR